MFGLTFGQFMFLGILSLIAWILSDFLVTITVDLVEKINDKKGRENNEKKL